MSVEQKILQALVENSSTKSLSKIFYWYIIPLYGIYNN